VHFSLLRSYQGVSAGPRLNALMFRNMIRFYTEDLLAPRPTPKVEDHPLSAVSDCLFDIIAATLHIEGLPPSATWGRAMPWWQGPTYHGAAYHGPTYHGAAYHGHTYHGAAYHGPTYHGTDYHGPTYHGPTYNGPAYHGPTYRGLTADLLIADPLITDKCSYFIKMLCPCFQTFLLFKKK
jgi:hypothetical protein